MKIDWDMEKALLAFMLVLILGVVGVVYWQRGLASELQAAMPTAEKQLAEVGLLFMQNNALQNEIEEDKVAQGARPFEYLVEMGTASGIGRQAFSIKSPDTADPYDGYRDEHWELKTQGSNKSFPREAIARYLLFVETNSNRMRVTRLRLNRDEGKNARPDTWTPIITVTDRKPEALE